MVIFIIRYTSDTFEATANSARNAAATVVVVFGVPLVGQGHELALV